MIMLGTNLVGVFSRPVFSIRPPKFLANRVHGLTGVKKSFHPHAGRRRNIFPAMWFYAVDAAVRVVIRGSKDRGVDDGILCLRYHASLAGNWGPNFVRERDMADQDYTSGRCAHYRSWHQQCAERFGFAISACPRQIQSLLPLKPRRNSKMASRSLRWPYLVDYLPSALTVAAGVPCALGGAGW